jgi:hypothetical protein
MGPHIECPAPDKAHSQEGEAKVNVLKKLQNPFALVVQGFIVGGVLFWTTQGQATQTAVSAPAPIAMSVSAD